MTLEPLVPVVLVVAVAVVAAGWVVWSWRAGGTRGRLVRHLAMVGVAAVLLVRPGEDRQQERRTPVLDLDVVVAVDVTTSMAAEDYDGENPRFAGVQADVDALLTDLAGARFSLVTFGADAVVEVPFTTDGAAVRALVDTLRAEPYFLATGSSLERPVEVLETVLADAADAGPDRGRLLVVLSDGEEVGDDAGGTGSYRDLAELVDHAVVLGYGTADGGPMREGRVDAADDDGDYLRDGTGDIAISRIDEANLTDIADELGGEYRHRTAPGGLDDVVDPGDVDTMVADDAAAVARVDVVWVPALLLGALVLWELWALTVAGREIRLWRTP